MSRTLRLRRAAILGYAIGSAITTPLNVALYGWRTGLMTSAISLALSVAICSTIDWWVKR